MNSKYRRHAALTASLAMAAFMACGCLLKQPPDPFALLSPEDSATGVEYRPTLTWSESAGAKTFSLWLSTSEGVFGTEELLVADAPWTTSLELPEDLARGRTYWWRVEARNSDGRTACAEDHCFRIEFTVLHVDASAAGANDGSSWAAAFTSIHDALDASTPGDEVWVAAGLYRPTRRTDLDEPRTATFAMVDGVGIYGGFAGGEAEFGERDWQANETVLCGDIGVAGNVADNAYHVVLGAEGAVLDGFTVTGGNASGVGDYRGYGGGMFNKVCSPKIANCVFTGNNARYGGGMYNAGGSPEVESCSFVENVATDNGGGVSSSGSNITFTRCSFIRNSAYNGGGMYSRRSDVLVDGCSFSGNAAFFDEWSCGGGMHNYLATVFIKGSIFTGNAAYNHGGGIYNTESSLNVVYSHFADNAALYGGGVYASWSDILIISCCFTKNLADKVGGGVRNINGTVRITNSTFVSNAAGIRGGAVAGRGESNLDSSTITTNCVLWGNLPDHGGTISGSGFYIPTDHESTFSYCLIEGCAGFGEEWDAILGIDGGGNIDADPFFIDLDSDDLRLTSSSPCINAGTNAPFLAGGVAEGMTTDLDGNPRIVGGRVDIGAYEYQGD